MNMRPPKWADKFLAWYCHPDLLEEIQGDAHELYFERVKNQGKFAADWKYVWDVIRFFRWSNIRKSDNTSRPVYLQVLWNLNFKIALRNALRNKLTFFVKVFGLSVSLAFALIACAFVIQEFTFDRHFSDHERIFRVGLRAGIHGNITNYAVSPHLLRFGLEDEVPEVESAFRFRYSGKPMFRIEDETFSEETSLIVCENFLKVLTFDFVQGTPTALDDPNKIVLTESTAGKFFGDSDPMGQSIDIGWTQLEVAAIIKDVSKNTHLQFDALVSWDTFDFNDSWDNINAYTYIKLRDDVTISDVKSKIHDVFLNHREEIVEEREDLGGEIIIEPIIDALDDIHLSEFRDEDIAVKGNSRNLNILIVVITLLFIAGLINFHNLSLAELTGNLKKIGILKVFGGTSASENKAIVTHVLLSIFVILPTTAALSYVCLLLSESHFSIYIERSVFLSGLFLMIVMAFILTFIFSSKVNGLILSRANDLINALKGKLTIRHNGIQTRKFLVAAQLSFSIIMIALIVIVVDQFRFVNTMDKGFEDKNTIVVKMRSDKFSMVETFQESLRKLSGIKSVDAGSFYLDNVETKELFEIETSGGKKKMLVAYMNCGYNYLEALGIKLVKGRNFATDFSTDGKGAYIINETAAKDFGWKNPVGERIWGPLGSDRDEGEVIGVVKDFNFASLHNRIEPLIIFMTNEAWGASYVYVKLNPMHPQDILSRIQAEYKKIYTDLPFEWEYLDARYARLYEDDYQIKGLFEVGLVLSVLISCLGIFSMSAIMVIARAKEMGIRKVVGAGQLHLFGLHMRSFVQFIAIAVIMAWPVTYYLSNQWLDNFAYHIGLNAWYFILPCFIVLAIVLLISGYHGLKSSKMNPVDILKDE